MFDGELSRRAPEYVRLAPRFCDCGTEFVRLTYLSKKNLPYLQVRPRANLWRRRSWRLQLHMDNRIA
jgi:hypothetical protein